MAASAIYDRRIRQGKNSAMIQLGKNSKAYVQWCKVVQFKDTEWDKNTVCLLLAPVQRHGRVLVIPRTKEQCDNNTAHTILKRSRAKSLSKSARAKMP